MDVWNFKKVFFRNLIKDIGIIKDFTDPGKTSTELEIFRWSFVSKAYWIELNRNQPKKIFFYRRL